MTAAVPFDLPAESLGGRVAVVTGASRGLGAGLAARFAERGLSLGLCARSEPAAPTAAGVRALARSVDVTDAGAVEAFADAVTAELGPIDLWVNNAGVLDPMGPVVDQDPAEVDRALRVNVAGVVNGTRAFARRARDWPADRRVLVNVSSGAARSATAGWAIYGATKAAADHFTSIVAVEEPDLVCRAVAPGVLDTDMQALIRTHDADTFPAIERFREIHRSGAWSSPAWVADHLLGLLAGTWDDGEVLRRVPAEPR